MTRYDIDALMAICQCHISDLEQSIRDEAHVISIPEIRNRLGKVDQAKNLIAKLIDLKKEI